MRTVKDVRDTEVQKDMVRTWSFYEVFGSVESITRMYVARSGREDVPRKRE